MLLRQLRRRFGDLPAELETRVGNATTDQLDNWSELFVDAKSLDDLFSGQPH